MAYNFDTKIDRKNTNSIKWDFTEEFFGEEDLLPMWVADMDFKAPIEVINKIEERAEHGVYGYTSKPDSFYESIINWLDKRHNWKINKKSIMITPGVVPGINLSIMAYTEPKDKIIIQSPVYFPFFDAVKENDRTLINNPLKKENGKYKIDYEDLKSKIDEDTKMIILCNPHNPVGRVWSKEELKELADICIENDIIVLSDEIHSDIIYEGSKHTPIASISEEMAERTITFMAPSKTFNVAGLSTAMTIIENKKMRKQFNKMLNKLHLSLTNVFGIVGLEACYKYGEDWLEDLKKYLQNNIDYTINFIEENIPEIKVNKPEGTFLMWLDFSGLSLSEDEIDKLLLKDAKVALNKGKTFGKGGEYHRRLNIGCPLETLKEALNRMEKAINKK